MHDGNGSLMEGSWWGKVA